MLNRHVLPVPASYTHAAHQASSTVALSQVKQMCRAVTVSVCAATLLALSACSSTKFSVNDVDAGDPQAIMSLEEHLAQAGRAEGSGDKDKARGLYRQAARAYPVAEEPWRKLAESYFNVGDYGNAILASQEVMQRNPKDPTAASVLAISGLRLSTQALGVLREQADAQRAKAGTAAKPMTKSAIIVAARLEAETLARNLRDVLGEPVLVPNDPPAAGQPANRPRALGGAARPVTPTAKPAAAANPFDKLK